MLREPMIESKQIGAMSRVLGHAPGDQAIEFSHIVKMRLIGFQCVPKYGVSVYLNASLISHPASLVFV